MFCSNFSFIIQKAYQNCLSQVPNHHTNVLFMAIIFLHLRITQITTHVIIASDANEVNSFWDKLPRSRLSILLGQWLLNLFEIVDLFLKMNRLITARLELVGKSPKSHGLEYNADFARKTSASMGMNLLPALDWFPGGRQPHQRQS